MRGGYAAATYWNNHYVNMEQRAADAGVAHVKAHAEEIREKFATTPPADLWSAYYEWLRATAPQIQSDLYHYGLGSGSGARIVYSAFREVLE